MSTNNWKIQPTDVLNAGPVMPVMVIQNLEDAVPLAKALVAGGIKVLEITLRTPIALEAIRLISQEVKEAIDHIRGGLLLSMENSSNQAEWYGDEELFLDQVRTPEQFMKRLEKVTAADVKAMANEILNEKKMKMAVIGPYKNEDAFLKSINA